MGRIAARADDDLVAIAWGGRLVRHEDFDRIAGVELIVGGRLVRHRVVHLHQEQQTLFIPPEPKTRVESGRRPATAVVIGQAVHAKAALAPIGRVAVNVDALQPRDIIHGSRAGTPAPWPVPTPTTVTVHSARARATSLGR